MTRVAFAQRYTTGGTILTEPLAPTGHETYYHRRREWFTWCRDCGDLRAHATEHDALRATKRPCPQPVCPPPPRRATPRWTPEEDAIAATHAPTDAAALLPGRSVKAIALRRMRLANKGRDVTTPARPPKPPCGFPGCGRPVRAKHLCSAHLNQSYRGGPLVPVRYRSPRKKDT